jgi:hypothetical protein
MRLQCIKNTRVEGGGDGNLMLSGILVTRIGRVCIEKDADIN